MKLLLLLNLPEPVRNRYRDRLAAAFPDLEVCLVDHHSRAVPAVRDAEILVTFSAHLAPSVLAEGRRLRWVQALGTGVDGIVDSPDLAPGVIVTNLHGLHGDTVPEAAVLSMLALARNLPRSLRSQAAHRWDRFPSTLLHGKTVGIVGVGAIATSLAPLCRAFGMTVVGISGSPRDVDGFDAMRPKSPLAEVVGDLDFMVLLTPHSAETDRIVDGSVLRAMKPSAFLVNLARGGVVDEDALVEALRERRIAGAALDVFATEPLPEAHVLWELGNVIITPHMAGFHTGYADEALPIVEANMRHFLAGEVDQMANLVRS